MKTIRPLLICLIFVSSWLSSAPARANQVGYVNVVLTNGYNFIANPLNNFSPNNSLTNIIPSPPAGTIAYVWDVTNQIFLAPAVYDEFELAVCRT